MYLLWKGKKMTNLTEQWKKGELPSGYYYVKNEFGNIFPSDYSEDYEYISDTVIKDFFTEVSEIKEVLEQVPSFKEYIKLKTDCKTLAHKLLQVKPELRDWLEINFKEYL